MGSINMFLISIPPVVILLMSNRFALLATTNSICQLAVFLLTANIPALLTGRMSYVDIAWPWGLVTIGLSPMLAGTHWPVLELGRENLVMVAYLVSGLRMEMPRYLFQRRRWAKQGVTDETSMKYKVTMQKEILVQCLANMGCLAMPLLVQTSGYLTGPLTWLEVVGWTMWVLS